MILQCARRSKYYQIFTLLRRLPEASRNAPMLRVVMIPMRKSKQLVHYRQFLWPVEDPQPKIAQLERDETYERPWKPNSLRAVGCSWPRSQKSIKCVSQLDYEILESNVGYQQNLDILKQQVEAMQTECDVAQEKLQATNVACKNLLERADGLRLQR